MSPCQNSNSKYLHFNWFNLPKKSNPSTYTVKPHILLENFHLYFKASHFTWFLDDTGPAGIKMQLKYNREII